MKATLTVLTDPIPVGRFRLKETLRRIARPLRDLVRPPPLYRRGLPYRGHFAVTRSLVEGLRKIGANANYNPVRLADVGEVVLVLSGLETLRQAINWKREGRIGRLLAGPNILVFPSDHPDLIAAPEVDCCITPSDWVRGLYEDDCPSLVGRCAPWPAGVDTEYWCPEDGKRDAKRVVVFQKHSVALLKDCVQVLEQQGFHPDVVAYGSYTPAEYLTALRRASLMVGFATSESQGLAWAEAWSVDVPTLLWRQDHNTIGSRTFSSSTAPYLSSGTGLPFSSVAEFETRLTAWDTARDAFSPRNWILENMSDEVSARHLCRIAGVSVA